MKEISDMDNIPINSSARTSRSRYDNSNFTPISKIEDYQTSMSVFSTRIESKNNNINFNTNTNPKNKKWLKKEKKKVEFNPLITIVNIESFKKENYEGTSVIEEESHYEFFKKENEKKCILCSIF